MSVHHASGRSTQRFKPYQADTDSGVERLGEIQTHGQVTRLKFVAPVSEQRAAVPEGDLPYVALEHIESGTGKLMASVGPSPAENGTSIFRPGDVLFGKLRPYLAKVLRADFAGTCSTELLVLRSNRDIDPAHLAYQMLSSGFIRWIDSMTYGTKMPRANPEQVANTRVVIPPKSDQAAIVAFLDRETAKVDVLVAKKERVIELLHEKRSALITQSVTKGLYPDIPMKDSGIEWLGEIPAHWEVKKLKAVASLQTGITLGKRYETGPLEVRPYLRVANVQDGYLDLDNITEIELPRAEARRYELRVGDVLMTEGGDFDKLGRGEVWDGQILGCLHQNHIFAVRPIHAEVHPRFLATVMGSSYGRAYFTATSKQSTNRAATNSTKLKNLPVALPEADEQEEILRFITSEAGRLDVMIGRIQDGIGRLREFRGALISAAVMGRIDVREAS